VETSKNCSMITDALRGVKRTNEVSVPGTTPLVGAVMSRPDTLEQTAINVS
jgi:hypothetical protein